MTRTTTPPAEIHQAEFIFNMGDKVRDVVTGFTGIVVTRIDYMTGCNHYGVESQAKDGSGKPEYENCDEQRLKLVKPGAVALVRKYEAVPEAPARVSPGRSVPKRAGH
jgi:hypothetical protein